MESTSIELLHSIQLDMLVKFDRICEENNLTYFLDSGTALGAVRHGGFIPWDDDVDVGMPREDYDKLLRINASELDDSLVLQTYMTDRSYMMPFAKLRLKNSFFPEKDKYVEKLAYNGIYIDIFPYDNVPQKISESVRRIKHSRLLYYMAVFGRRDYPGKKLPQRMASWLLHRFPDRITIWIHRVYDCYCTKYNKKSTGVLTCFCWRMSQRNTILFDSSDLFPTKKILFEGKELCVVHNPQAYLKKMYGNYLELPPESERSAHLIGAFRFDE